MWLTVTAGAAKCRDDEAAFHARTWTSYISDDGPLISSAKNALKVQIPSSTKSVY